MIPTAPKELMHCVACGFTWVDGPGMHGKCMRDGCPSCRSFYWVWTTYRG